MYGALADFPYTNAAYAILEACYGCPEVKVRNGVVLWIGASAVNGLTAMAKKRPDIADTLRAAEEILSSAPSLMVAMGVTGDLTTDNLAIMALGRLFIQMGRFLLKKQESNAIVHESVDGVAATFVLDVAESFKQVTREPVANFWPNAQQVLDHQEQKKTNQVDPQALNLYKLDASGALADTRARLRTEGLDHGACVAARNHDFLWRIEASTTEDASGDNVTLKHIVVIAPWPGQEERKTTPLLGTKGSGSDEASRNVQLHEFLQNFEARNPKDIPRRLPNAAKGAFFQSEAGLTLRAKAQIFLRWPTSPCRSANSTIQVTSLTSG